jgi:hypothetical protein
MEAQILAIGMPTPAVSIGILLDARQNDRTNQRVSELKVDVQRQLDGIGAGLKMVSQDLRAFYAVNAEHSVKIQNLERKAS